MSHLGEKMKLLAQGTSGFAALLETKIDAAIASHQQAQTEIIAAVDTAFAQVDAINQDAQSGVAAIQAELKNLTN
jgi:hypothetical protein